jgi:hypothetical protein
MVQVELCLLSTDLRFYTGEIKRTDEGVIKLGHDDALGDET